MSRLLPLSLFAAALFALPSLALADIPPDSESDSEDTATDTATSTDTGTSTGSSSGGEEAGSAGETGEDEAKGCSLGGDAGAGEGPLALSLLVLCGAGLSLRRRPR